MPSSSPVPSSTLSHEHLLFCFDVIHAHLKHTSVPDDVALPDADEKFPMFITWNTVSGTSSSSVRLRGCIGTFEPLPLKQGLQDYSIISAFRDRRFSPISIEELPRLECAISLLTNFEECNDYLDWELGTHGIYIDFLPPSAANGSTSNGGGLASRLRSNGRSSTSARRLSATYLPDVAPAQGWTKVEAIDSAIHKAGYEGKVTDELRRSLHVRRYRSEKASARYAEWKTARKIQQA